MSTQIKEKDFKTIYTNTYNKTLKFIIVKCNNIDDINDIIQDTYLELLKVLKQKKILELEKVDNFILGIANNIIKRHYRKVSKKNNIFYYTNNEQEEFEDIKAPFDLEQDFITKENMKEVWEYIKSKDLEIAKIFYLYFSLGLKISEIANELNLKESNVKNKIYRTLKELKKYLRKDVINND